MNETYRNRAKPWAGHLSLGGLSVRLIVLVLLASDVVCPAMVDTNTNGMSDVWETAYGGTGLSPGGDADQDGQSNYRESVAGTDPYDAQSRFRIAACRFLPSDFVIQWQSVAGKRYQVERTNALTGTWEPHGPPVLGTGGPVLAAITPGAFRLRLLVDNPAVVNGRPSLLDQDTDGDGFADIDEYAAGTNPFDAGSFLGIGIIFEGPAVLLSWQSVAGKHYQVLSREDSLVSFWMTERHAVEGDGSVITVTVPASGSRRFFRVQVFDEDTDLDGVNDWEEQVTGLGMGPWHYRTNFPTALSTVNAILHATNVINLEVGAAVANVTTLTAGSLRVTRSGGVSQLTVHYTVGGDAVPGVDYVALGGTVTLAAGVNEVEIPVTPLAGAALTLARSVVVTVQPGVSYVVGTNASRELRVLKEVALSVRDFGAAGDGVMDDTAAIQAAINALEASSNHNTLHFPPGVYRLNTPTLVNDKVWGSYSRLLKVGNSDLAGRDLLITSDPGAELYSTVNWVYARMLVAEASFRSLTFRGLTWRKSSELLPAKPGAEPNGAEGVWLRFHDLRRVEAVDFLDCTFNNCHGAVHLFATGSDFWGKLAHLGFFRCQILNPYGSNTTDAQTASSGGQQVRFSRWVAEAIYRDNLFDGGSDNPDLTKNPGGIRKDGAHFGAPLNLLFTNNIVRRMGVEAVFQTDEPYVGSTQAPFNVPPADGTSTVQVALHPLPSSHQPGQIINFRTWFGNGTPAVNILLTVTAWDSTNRLLTVKNTGLTAGMAGVLVPFSLLYLQADGAENATIVGNVFDHGELGQNIAITARARTRIAGNFLKDYRIGVGQYGITESVLFPPARGTVIDSNVVLTRDQSVSATTMNGIVSYGPEDVISDNLIATPESSSFIGIFTLGADSWVEGNMIIPGRVVRHTYGSNARSVGIQIGNTSTGCTAAANWTYGLDVGIGPDAYQLTPHRVISHFSTNDVLAVDPRGLTGN